MQITKSCEIPPTWWIVSSNLPPTLLRNSQRILPISEFLPNLVCQCLSCLICVFGFWATGECHHSSLITGQDLAFASMTKHYKSYEKVSSFFKKFLSRHHIKIYKNITKSFEKYLLRISFLLFYCSHFRSAALLFYLKLPNTIPFSLPSNVKMAAWFGFLKMFWFTTCVLIFLYLLDLKLFFCFFCL